ncbi:MAG: protease inhibitor I9 family protein, partial [Bacillota bacterium]|nr:protease inhibitor I9 family protein [Bacillota bacterium]
MKKNNYFRVHLSFLLCSSLFMDFGHQAVHAEETNKVNNSEQEMVVLYKNAQGKEKIIETGNEVDYQFKNIKALAVKVDANDIRELKKDPNISDVEPDVSFKIAEETNDKAINLNTLSSSITTMPAEESQWDFQAMNGPEMLRQGITGKGVKVAVIDTGIANHFDLNIAGGISTV